MSSATAIVTGSSRGIGAAIARRLGVDGANVVVNYASDAAAAAEVVAAIEDAGGKAVAVGADATTVAGLRGLFDTAQREFGVPDVVVHNVGVARFGPIAETTDEDYAVLFDTNTRSTFFALREAANRIADGGRIVVVSSGVVTTGRADSGLYGASKAAADQLVRVLAKELGPRGVTVNSVLPGATRTAALHAKQASAWIEAVVQRIPLGRIAEPEDIADIVGFLVSHDGRWVTGQTLNAGGGQF